MLFVQVRNDPYKKERDLRNVIAYTFGEHCKCGLYGAQGLLVDTADSMYANIMEEKREFTKDSGRMAIHIIVSFDQDMMKYISPEVALHIGYDICAECFSGFQIIFGVHDNTDNLHIHFVVNTVSYYTGNKFSKSIYDLQKINKEMERIVNAYKPINYVNTIDELDNSI